MLRLVAAARRHLPVGSLQVAPVSVHFTLLCIECRRHYSSSESPAYQVPSVVCPEDVLVWQKTVNPALQTYFKLNKGLFLPSSFVVPKNNSNWPEETWGYPLGKHAVWLRKYWKKGKLPDFAVQELKEIEFPFDFNQYKWDHFLIPALSRYYELYGHSDVPSTFRVKSGDSNWSEKLWGFGLGAQVQRIRNGGIFKAQVEEDREKLERIEFYFESSIANREWNTRVLPSLRIYRQEFGSCDVSQRFVVPDCPPWPRAAAGLRLGNVVKDMRYHKNYALQSARDADVLEKLGFVWDLSWAKWNDVIFPTFETFKLEEGHGNIPFKYVVPYTTPWPEKSHGLMIGKIVYRIRTNCYYFDQIARSIDRLAALDFEFPIAQNRWDQRVRPMIATFEELHGHRDVPLDFIVPSEAPWKETDWGIQLGKLKRKET
ncbi:hypothetical protein DVH05_015452 [Phytophthora capsici]|nr:hypothetical protein DVH05_015452 [Phytophthora capsici]|eukprot:jgi/Phyca11/106994/e_gw1.13.319.1